MSEELKKVLDEELDDVSGGRHHNTGHRNGIEDCPPGTIEIKNEQLKNAHEKKKKCPFCDNKKGLEEHSFYMVDTHTLVEGQSCPNCHNRWITHG